MRRSVGKTLLNFCSCRVCRHLNFLVMLYTYANTIDESTNCSKPCDHKHFHMIKNVITCYRDPQIEEQ